MPPPGPEEYANICYFTKKILSLALFRSKMCLNCLKRQLSPNPIIYWYRGFQCGTPLPINVIHKVAIMNIGKKIVMKWGFWCFFTNKKNG